MNPERWELVQELLAELAPLPEEERGALLDERCGPDGELRDEVESLLRAGDEADGYFDDLAGRTERQLASRKQDDRPSESLAGRDLAQFRVVEKIGEGGMGEVYRATDVELRRDVALKVLRERLVEDPHLVARFRREAQVLASLNHQSIAGIYGLRAVDGRQMLVLEFVDGRTLKELMAERRPSRERALEIARDLAVALEAAHGLGIVHRDLKPSNVKVTTTGKVKVLDFGIAKAVHGDPDTGSDHSPATDDVLAATMTGFVVGSVSYMSPEQLKGKLVDTRSDVWAFGALLFELLSGQRPFPATGFALTVAKILEHPPDWGALPADLDPRLRHLLERCLERDVQRRLQAIGEARIILEDVMAGPAPESVAEVGGARALGGGPATRSSASRLREHLAGAVVGGLIVAATGLVWALRPEAPRPVERFASPLRAGQRPVFYGLGAFGLSPDGSAMVYRGPGEGGGGNRLWVRRWTEVDGQPLRGTEGAVAPVISPDGQQLAFSQGGEVKVMSLAGGPSRTVAEGINPTWGTDGSLYVTIPTGVGRVIPDGTVETVTERRDGDQNHFLAGHLPDGRHALMSIDRDRGPPELHVVDLESGAMERIGEGILPYYASTGHLVYLLDGTLMAAAFDPDARAVEGVAAPLEVGVLGFAISADGTLLYSRGGAASGSRSELVWVTRTGDVTPVSEGWVFDRGGANPGWTLSPDGTRIALRIGSDLDRDIWIRDLEAGTLARLTFDEAEERKPTWSPDGRSVLFLSDRAGDLDVWTRSADGSGQTRLVWDHPIRIAEAFWAPDGTRLVLRTAGVQDLVGGRDIYTVRPGIDAEAQPVVDDEFDEAAPALSPDGRFLAYASTETGRYEVYVRGFPGAEAGRWLVTTQGGTAPRWAHNGRELFYVDGSRQLVSVRYETEPSFRVVGSTTLFTIPAGFDLAQVATLYDVSPDDRRFLMARVYAGSDADQQGPEVVLVRNWDEELRRRVRR